MQTLTIEQEIRTGLQPAKGDAKKIMLSTPYTLDKLAEMHRPGGACGERSNARRYFTMQAYYVKHHAGPLPDGRTAKQYNLYLVIDGAEDTPGAERVAYSARNFDMVTGACEILNLQAAGIKEPARDIVGYSNENLI